MARNEAANIECHQFAVSDKDGLVRFVMLEHARHASLATGVDSGRPEQSIEIHDTTLDSSPHSWIGSRLG